MKIFRSIILWKFNVPSLHLVTLFYNFEKPQATQENNFFAINLKWKFSTSHFFYFAYKSLRKYRSMLVSCLQQSNFIFISSIFKLHKRRMEKLASDGRLRKFVVACNACKWLKFLNASLHLTLLQFLFIKIS